MQPDPATTQDLLTEARAWSGHDPDPSTRAEIESMIERRDLDALRERFAGPLRFGTAGLRGALGGGPSRMNRAVVRRAAAGLGAWLTARQGPARVVIGRDARRGSDEFAEDTARVLAAAGHVAVVLPAPVPTPVLAFSVRRLSGAAGVMVTASHNPPGDNGYKVYLGDGAQLVPPADDEIAAAIDAAPPADRIPLATDDDDRIERVDPSVIDAYVELAAHVVPRGPRDVTVAYTPLHGVGGAIARRAFERAGFTRVHMVAEQADPDPDFPTVSFPNPEEPGALDLVCELATAVQADVVIANDPDADRLGVAVRDGDRWRALTGNEIGALLADQVLASTSGNDRLVVTTVVSSQLLRAQAATAAVHYAEVPTGFKWVVRPALDDPDLRFVFGYEEALGFSVVEEVRDKDGITAALAFVGLVAELRSQGRTVLDRLADLAVQFGHHASGTTAIRLEGREGRRRIGAAMVGLRAEPPEVLAGRPVLTVVDHADGTHGLPPSNLVALEMDGARVLVRPSGTEPKLKLYAEAVMAVEGGVAGYVDARRRGQEVVDALAQDAVAELGIR